MSSHCIVDAKSQSLRCLRCGQSIPLGLPDRALAFAGRIDTFCTDHRDCLPVGHGDMADALKQEAAALRARNSFTSAKLLEAAAKMLEEVATNGS